MLKNVTFPLTLPNRTSNDGIDFSVDFSLQSAEFTAAYSLKSEKYWPVDFAELWSRKSDSVYNHVSKGATNHW